MKQYDELKRILREGAKEEVPIQTVWVTVKTVDWDARTMACEDYEGLEIFDVKLGLGTVLIKPKVGTRALIGLVENRSADGFLIECTEAEELYFNADKITFKGQDNGGLVKIKELVAQVNKNSQLLTQIKMVFQTWAAVQGDGGAALKLAAAAFTNLPVADLANIENKDVNHA